jgi:hypothetical protein
MKWRRNKAANTQAFSIPHQTTEQALEEMTDAGSFHALCDKILASHEHFMYEVYPKGRRGGRSVPGLPDSTARSGLDRQGKQ